RLESGEEACNDVAGSSRSGPVAEAGRPRLVLPRDEIALRIDRRAQVDQIRVAIILPSHLILAGELNAHRLSHRLRQQRSIIGYSIGAIQSIAARAAPENHVYVLRLQPEHHGRGVALKPQPLVGRTEMG